MSENGAALKKKIQALIVIRVMFVTLLLGSSFLFRQKAITYIYELIYPASESYAQPVQVCYLSLFCRHCTINKYLETELTSCIGEDVGACLSFDQSNQSQEKLAPLRDLQQFIHRVIHSYCG